MATKAVGHRPSCLFSGPMWWALWLCCWPSQLWVTSGRLFPGETRPGPPEGGMNTGRPHVVLNLRWASVTGSFSIFNLIFFPSLSINIFFLNLLSQVLFMANLWTATIALRFFNPSLSFFMVSKVMTLHSSFTLILRASYLKTPGDSFSILFLVKHNCLSQEMTIALSRLRFVGILSVACGAWSICLQ